MSKFTKTRENISILKNKQFLGLWVSQVFSQVSTHTVNFALITRVFNQTSSSIAVSILVFWFAAPAVLMGVLAGVYVDRWNRKMILILINFFQALLVLGYFFAGTNIFLIYPIVFFYALLNQFFIPSEGAMIPTIVPKEKLVAANSFYLFTNYASFILGYALAGPLIIFWGPNFIFFLASSLLFVATLAVTVLPNDRKRALYFRARNVRTPLLKNVRNGLSFIRRTGKVSFSIAHLLLVQIVIAAILALGPSFAKYSLKIGVESISFALIAPAGIGVAVGAFILNRIKERYKVYKLVKFGVVSASLILILLTVTHKIGPLIKSWLLQNNGLQFLNFINLLFTVSLLVVLLGFFASFIIIPAQTILQEETPSDLRGRVFGITGTLVNVMALIPLLLFGILADIFSAAMVFVALGILMLGYGLFLEPKVEERVSA